MNWGPEYFWSVEMFSHVEFYIGTLIFCVIAYLIGSINGGQIISLLGSKNLGEVGTKNFGATNASRAYGKKGFIFVFVFDMLKAVAVGLILTLILNSANDPTDLFYYASIPFALIFVGIGHSWPIYFRFKGGKAVAVSFGTVIIVNWLFAIISISIFILVLKKTRNVAVSSIIGTSVGVLLIITSQPFFPETLVFNWSVHWISILSAIFIEFLVVYRHKKNIMDIINGDDQFIRPKKNKKDANEKELNNKELKQANDK